MEVRYRPVVEEDDQDQLQGILNAVDELQAEGRGDILIFMNGEREIRDTAEALQKQNLKHTEILPLFARLSAQEQNQNFPSKWFKSHCISDQRRRNFIDCAWH